MALRDIDEKGGVRELSGLDHQKDFDKKWDRYTPDEQRAIVEAIDAKLDELVSAPDSRWGSIMNTSIEGAKVNPFNGKSGDRSDTPWGPIYDRSGESEQKAALFFGLLWRWRIIKRPEQWIGIRNTPDARPTFPNRGVTLGGKTYFLASKRNGSG
jgi:hypothetical protein